MGVSKHWNTEKYAIFLIQICSYHNHTTFDGMEKLLLPKGRVILSTLSLIWEILLLIILNMFLSPRTCYFMFFICIKFILKRMALSTACLDVHNVSGCSQCLDVHTPHHVWMSSCTQCVWLSTACLDVRNVSGCSQRVWMSTLHSMSGCPQCVWLSTACLDVHTPQHV